MKMHAQFAASVALAISTPLAAETYTHDATGRLTSVGYDNDLNGNISRIATLVDSAKRMCYVVPVDSSRPVDLHDGRSLGKHGHGS